MKTNTQLILIALLFFSANATNATVIITGIVDPDYDFNGRAIELYADGTVDLANYKLQRAANGLNSFNTNIALSGTYTDQFIYVVNTASSFADAWGNSGDFANIIENTNVSGNGNDAFRLVDAAETTIYDMIGDPSNTSDTWEDGWIYKLDEVGNVASWNAANFTVSGNNVLDGLTAAQTAEAVPFATYTVPEPATYAALLGGLAFGFAAFRRRHA